MTRARLTRWGYGWAVATIVGVALVQLWVLRGVAFSEDVVNPIRTGLAFSSVAVLLPAFALPWLVGRFDLRLSRWVPWLIGGLSALLALVPWLLMTVGFSAWASAIYRGLRIPQGIREFWDLALILDSIDCAQAGVDVYAFNNGCLADPTIYGPSTLWLQWAPFDLFSARNAGALGVVALIVSSLALVFIARLSTSRGQLVLLLAVFGAPWLLLLERGNFDAFVIWAAVLLVFLVRRWPGLWAWSIGAAAIWVVGTWKYYPFALGLMLLPLLRVRRGWLVLLGFVVATVAYLAVYWDKVLSTLEVGQTMADLGDFVVLGRIPMLARMVGEAPDLLIFAMAVAAMAWGVVFGLQLRRIHTAHAMLAAGGSALFLAAVLITGFGYAYKAAFLLLAVPLLSLPILARSRFLLGSSLTMLGLTAVASIVVWNTMLASTAGIVAASFALGVGGVVLLRLLSGRDLPQGQLPGLAHRENTLVG